MSCCSLPGRLMIDLLFSVVFSSRMASMPLVSTAVTAETYAANLLRDFYSKECTLSTNNQRYILKINLSYPKLCTLR